YVMREADVVIQLGADLVSRACRGAARDHVVAAHPPGRSWNQTRPVRSHAGGKGNDLLADGAEPILRNLVARERRACEADTRGVSRRSGGVVDLQQGSPGIHPLG